LKKRKKEHKWDKNIGSYLKRRRLDLKRKQDWVAKGICSVSYLSKIENNKAEENPTIVREIMEKLEVEPKNIELNIGNKQYLDQAITAFYFRDSTELRRIYNKVKDGGQNLTIDLIRLMYFIANHDERANPLILALEQVIPSMDDLNLQVFLVLAGFFYGGKEQYFYAYEWFHASLEVEQKSECFTALSNMKMYELNQRLLKKNHSSTYGLEARRLMLRHHNWIRLNQFNLNRIDCIFKELPNSALKELKNIQPSTLHGEQKMHYYLALAKANLKIGHLEEVKQALFSIDKSSKYYFDALVLLYEITEDLDEKESIKSELLQTKITKTNQPAMIRFRLLSIKDNRLKKEYLKKVAIPYAKKVANLHLHAEYIKEISSICKESSRYKEATQYIDTHRKIMNKTSHFISQI
jgi:hypothetical protein